MVRDGMVVGSLDMSIATERRQFYDSEIRLAAGRRYAHLERRHWLAVCRVNTKRFLSFARKRIARQGERRSRRNAKHKMSHSAPHITSSCAALSF
jgi:hypothetical protein